MNTACLLDQIKLESIVTSLLSFRLIVSSLMFARSFLGSEIKWLATNKQTPLAKKLLIKTFQRKHCIHTKFVIKSLLVETVNIL